MIAMAKKNVQAQLHRIDQDDPKGIRKNTTSDSDKCLNTARPPVSTPSYHIKYLPWLQVFLRCPSRVKIVHDTLQDSDGEQRADIACICLEPSVLVPRQ